MVKLIALLAASLFALPMTRAAEPPGPASAPVRARDTESDTWSATDAIGRKLPTFAEAGGPRAGKTVGIFYFLWEESRYRGPVFDITRLLAENPGNPQWGPRHSFHWWGEPHLGYYVSDDEYVIRRHAQMLADAGVDVIICDVTNAFTYDQTVLTLCRVYEQIRREGGRTPQLAFIAHSKAAQTVQHLYDVFYSKNLYPQLWFRWLDKPLILAPSADLPPAVRDFFTFRESWAWTKGQPWFGDGRDRWPWLDHTPQQPGWHEDPSRPEAICVCVAEHPTSNIGRSFHDGQQPAEARPAEGLYFAEQWRRALQVDPQFIFVTGWNEWIAQRFVVTNEKMSLCGRPLREGDSFFVDQYSQEYSRDIEPMRGGHGDSYYYQMVAGIRRFKGVRPAPPVEHRTIDMGGGVEQWLAVKREYLDDGGDTAHRRSRCYGGERLLVNESGRNDLECAKAAVDAQNICFYVRTRADLTAPAGDDWMVLLIDADGQRKTGWEGYDLMVNRSREGGFCSVERSEQGWSWKRVGQARWAMAGRELHIAIPRQQIEQAGWTDRTPLEFKWADHVPLDGNIARFIDEGDVAPNGRFNYVLPAETPGARTEP